MVDDCEFHQNLDLSVALYKRDAQDRGKGGTASRQGCGYFVDDGILISGLKDSRQFLHKVDGKFAAKDGLKPLTERGVDLLGGVASRHEVGDLVEIRRSVSPYVSHKKAEFGKLCERLGIKIPQRKVVSPGVDVEVGGRRDVGELVDQDLTGAVDVGTSIQVGRYRSDAGLPSAFTLGLGVQNLGPDLELEGSTLGLAHRVTAGASFQRWLVGPFDLGASAALSREADGAWIPALGGEVAWWPVTGRTFTGWIGVRRVDGPSKRVTFGGAFRRDALGIEYAFQGFDTFGGAHRFGISWR